MYAGQPCLVSDGRRGGPARRSDSAVVIAPAATTIANETWNGTAAYPSTASETAATHAPTGSTHSTS